MANTSPRFLFDFDAHTNSRALVEERLIGFEEPTQEDVEAIREYEAAKKNGKLTLVPLSDLLKGT